MLSSFNRPSWGDCGGRAEESCGWRQWVRLPLGFPSRRSSGTLPKQAMLLGAVVLLICSAGVRADDALLTTGDLILAIDQDIISQSSYPTAGNDERPSMILDGNVGTKYLNFGKDYSGFIVTPTHGSSTVRSMVLSTANDAEPRDPASYEIYGTNDAILSTNNSSGTGGENWTLISTGPLSLPVARLTAGPVVILANETAYASYKVLFPTVKNAASANSMQIAEVAMYETPDGTGTNVLSEGGAVLAIDANSASSYPVPAENPQNILDGAPSTKYLNFGKERSGFIVTPSSGPSTVRSMKLYTANDFEERDPASYEIYGTTDAIASTDNSGGTAESWTLISTGPLALPTARFTAGPVLSFTNETAYTSYKVLFPTVKDAAAGVPIIANSMQISEVAMYQTSNGTGTNVLTNGGTVLAIDADGISESSYVAAQSPPHAFDGDTHTRYLNSGELNSGFIVTPSIGLSVVTSFKITTADTAAESDPAAWSLYGTTDPITSTDNSPGDAESWTLIASGTVDLPTDRMTEGPVVPFANTAMFTSYRMIFTAVRDRATSVAMHFSEIQFYGTIANPLPDPLLKPGDFIIAFDLDPYRSDSSYPAGESPPNVLDGNTGTKYLNFAAANSGFIVTPASGSSTVRSMRLSTANDSPERDPASYELYGTNETILSTDNSLGAEETWTLISSGPLSLPELRLDATTVVAFAGNSTTYTSYKVIFPTLKDVVLAGMMQIADVALYPTTDGTGTSVLNAGDTIFAIDTDAVPASSYPDTQGPANAIDRVVATATGGAGKYLNFGKTNAGFIVTPSVGPSIVASFKLVTAEDAPERDPAGWELYGTNDTIVDLDNGRGNLENWTLIASGTTTLPDTRLAAGTIIQVASALDYTSYRMLFTSLKNTALADSFQFAEVQFYGSIGVACATPYADLDGDQDVDQDDFGLFQTCYTGPSGTVTSRMCMCLDKGHDGAVDVLDLIQFTNCLTGPAVPWTQDLTPGCSP